MKYQMVRCGLVLFVLATLLVGCGDSLPPEAREVVFNAFESVQKPRIVSVQQVEPLPQDLEMGAEEVWCVNLSVDCWSQDDGHQTCGDSRLVRRVRDDWQVSVVATDEDREMWEARGCELAEGVTWQPHVSF